VIALSVRWYVRYRLSYANVVAWFAERGLRVDRSTVDRWVQRFLPLFGAAARAYRRAVGTKWRVDETYVRLHGRWTYVYRAIDEAGQVVDAYFSERRNSKAAQPVFERAIDDTGMRPERVTTDRAKCYPAALRAVLADAEHRRSRSRNNGVERDHGPGTLGVKHRVRPMRGFQNPSAADTLCRGHGLIQNLRNGFSTLTQAVPRQLRLVTAWPQLTQAI
jgi:transposase-like protein